MTTETDPQTQPGQQDSKDFAQLRSRAEAAEAERDALRNMLGKAVGEARGFDPALGVVDMAIERFSKDRKVEDFTTEEFEKFATGIGLQPTKQPAPAAAETVEGQQPPAAGQQPTPGDQTTQPGATPPAGQQTAPGVPGTPTPTAPLGTDQAVQALQEAAAAAAAGKQPQPANLVGEIAKAESEGRWTDAIALKDQFMQEQAKGQIPSPV